MRDPGPDVVQIRTAPHVWAGSLVLVPILVLQAAVTASLGEGWAVLWSVVALLVLLQTFALRSFGVDLTPRHAVMRGLRRRRIPWSDVVAVIPRDVGGGRSVRLVRRSGRPLTLRAPTTLWGIGTQRFWADYHRIGQWWLAHHGVDDPAVPADRQTT